MEQKVDKRTEGLVMDNAERLMNVEEEDQVPDEIAHERFDRLLSEVQTIGRRRSSRFEGTVQKVLVEEKNRQTEGLVTGRTPHNLVVHFPGDPSLIGTIVDVRLDQAHGFYYTGTVSEKK